jgi:hypothetical protein
MKKLAYFLSLVFLLTAFAPAAMADGGKEPTTLSLEDELRLEELNQRVLEIKAMSFAEMTKAEKKEIRSELREINKEAKRVGGGVYISAGAIIILLIIILLVS